ISGEIKNNKEKRENDRFLVNAFVVVEIDSDGNIINSDSQNLTLDEETLQSCVEHVISTGKDKGEISEESLMFVKKNIFGNTRIAFGDTSAAYSSLFASILVGLGLFLGSLVIVFLISLALSGLAVKPVKTAWEQQKQFVADASHELKTPLTVILANNNIVMSHPDNPVSAEKQWLESTEEEAQHMKKLIDQMLFLAKSDAGTAQVELSDVDFSSIVEGTSLNFEPIAFEKEVFLDLEIESGIVLHGNSMQLNQLAHILIDNAVKYSEKQGVVKIRLSNKGDKIEFSVNNKGNVISPEDLEHIFDRFYRAEKSRSTKGYGLGLAIAQSIVQSMNGKLIAESDAENGTTFTAEFKTGK
ncbi:MAG: HAMP domain-containing sensor histidine kinase, partial [Ruminococcus sp.]|nr:HAMP domain-containing sensor histidine kinase [Ruminococcus sp.]